MASLADRKCASVKTLQSIKDVTQEDAEAIRQAWKTIKNRQEAREAVDRIINTHGVEFLGIDKRSGASVYYCNAGDSYATTVCFVGLRMVVCCWADFVENDKVREPSPYDGKRLD